MRILFKTVIVCIGWILTCHHTLWSSPPDPSGTDPCRVVSESPRVIPGLKLVWHDEFDCDGRPDPLNWGFEYGFVRNRELQWYQSQNASCKDGRLIIEARRETIDNPGYNSLDEDWRRNREVARYSSACLITKDLWEFEAGGYFEIRARIDTALGSWPAAWLLGTQGRWPFNGEIDVMEYYRINGQPVVLANAVWGSSKAYSGEWDSEKLPLKPFLSDNPGWPNQYHIWSLDWDDRQIRLGLDGKVINTIELTKTVNPDGHNPFLPPQTFYVLLNLAIGSNGGDPSSTVFPIRYEVDYVRVYQRIQNKKQKTKQ